MRRRVEVVGFGAVVAFVLCAAGMVVPGLVAEGAQAGPTFGLTPLNQTVDLSAGMASVVVTVDNPQNVGSFQFVLRYDPGVLKATGAVPSAFLGSSGRQVQCQAPIINGPDGAGTVQFACGTLGNGSGASAAGITAIASVSFSLVGGEDTTIAIEKDTLSDPLANPLCVVNPAAPPTDADYLNTCPTMTGSVRVNGGTPSLQLGVGPTSTPVPAGQGTAPTATAASGAAAQPTVGVPATTSSGSSAPASRATLPAGVSVLGTKGSGSSSGPVGVQNGHPGVGSFGYGPPPKQRNNSRDMTLAAVALAVTGIALMGASAAVRRRRLARRA